MTITTIARLHRVAYSRVLGEQGTSACLYLGHALALATLDPVANASAIHQHVDRAKRIMLRKTPDLTSHQQPLIGEPMDANTKTETETRPVYMAYTFVPDGIDRTCTAAIGEGNSIEAARRSCWNDPERSPEGYTDGGRRLHGREEIRRWNGQAYLPIKPGSAALYDAADGRRLRSASAAEVEASDAEVAAGRAEGFILVDGRRCYVQYAEAAEAA